MFRLDKSLRAWGGADFAAVLKREVEESGAEYLPLQQGLSISSHVAGSPITLMILRVDETEKVIRIKAGIFYQGIIAGCSCADDPTPDSENNEYCEVRLDIDKTTAATEVALMNT
ncbi:MAG: hypothetical protein WCA64_11730 [Gallionella sp.]